LCRYLRIDLMASPEASYAWRDLRDQVDPLFDPYFATMVATDGVLKLLWSSVRHRR
jgi:hypothetical protein